MPSRAGGSVARAAPESAAGRPVPLSPAPVKKLTVRPQEGPPPSSFAPVLKRPRITEKASALSARGAYVFEVTPSANKRQVAAAVRALYNVTPRKIAIVQIPAKTIVFKGKPGKSPGGKKAYVHLKKGDKIEVV